jgi:hypothetical protein
MNANRRQELMAGIELPEGPWWDWDIVSCDGAELRLGAGYDLTYHHDLELVFGGPAFVSCPTSFQDPAFRAPTPDEAQSVASRLGELPPVLVAFEADAGGHEPTTCLISAERMTVRRGTVFRYQRENLKPGERLAPWVRAPES